MSIALDPLPPGERSEDELPTAQAADAMTQAFTRMRADLDQVMAREPILHLPKACPEFLLTDCQFEERSRGAVMVIKVREPLTISAEKVLRVRASKAWLRNIRARLNGMDL